MSSLRAAVERRSAVPLTFLSLHRRLVFLLVVVLLVLAAVLPAAAGRLVALPVLALAGWLSYLSWPALSRRDRVLRLVAVAVLAALLLLPARQ